MCGWTMYIFDTAENFTWTTILENFKNCLAFPLGQSNISDILQCVLPSAKSSALQPVILLLFKPFFILRDEFKWVVG